MTVDLLAGASSNKVSDWQAVDWPKVWRTVRRLQLRIAKAIRAGQHGKAQALSWLLTHSRSAKLLAVKRVLANLTLDGMEQAIRSRIKIRCDQVNFIRYADDFVVTARAKETLEQICQTNRGGLPRPAR